MTNILWRNPARLLVIVPTRSRPDNAEDFLDAWTATTAGKSDVLFAVDDDDPELPEYRAICDAYSDVANLYVGPRLRLGGTLNAVSKKFADAYDAICFMGDDHLPRTGRWDLAFLAELERLGTGVVYGDDLIHGAALPTAVAMTTDIVRELGYMVPAGLVHMWADNAWKAWGEGIGHLTYMPDVVIEHNHPLAGKAPMDDLYRETGALMEPDSRRWEDYRLLGGLAADVARLQHMMQVKAATAASAPDRCLRGHELSDHWLRLDGSMTCRECPEEQEKVRSELWTENAR